MNSERLSSLLAEVESIHQAQQNRRRKGAEDFNFFTAVCRYKDETRHSSFIASLLDPAGKHGQGALFLKLFLKEIAIDFDSYELEKWQVKTEVTFRDGRRIDILLSGPTQIIGIENKVHAEEGVEQLADYAKELSSYGRKAALVFLTPEGREPAAGQESVAKFGVGLVCASYAVGAPSISNWLEQCLKEAEHVSRLAELLRQYGEIVSRVSGFTMKIEDRQEVANILMSKERYAAAVVLQEALGEARVLIQQSFWEELAATLESDGLKPWKSEKGKPDRASIKKYYEALKKPPRPGLDYDTGLRWYGLALILRLELLPGHSRNLTWKFICRHPDEPTKPLPVETIPEYEKLAKALCGLDVREGFYTSKTSLATAKMILPSSTAQLDLTYFSGEAEALIESESRSEVISSLAEKIGETWQKAVGMAGVLDGLALAEKRSFEN